jgi:tetratricopeptide (TPR) repeat protein
VLTQIAGRFDIERVAGSGGLGVVYRCRDRTTGQLAAVKVAPRATSANRERFLREAEMLSTIAHPNVVRYVAHGLLDSHEPWLAMEWLEGEDLHARLERTPLSLGESIALTRHLAAALAAAHAAGIVHRDVKPANVILLGGDPAAPRLIDFGIARAGAQLLTIPGGVLGTPGYMAPEQARGEPNIDARADVFALGCVAYECLSGRRAFDGDSPMAILAKVLLEEPPRIRAARADVPAALEHAVDRMLAKARESRYGSAIEVVRDLDRLDVSTEEKARPKTKSGLLGTRERKLLALLVARRGEAPPKDATLVDDPEPAPRQVPVDRGLRDVAATLGSGAEVLLDGSLVVVFEGSAAVDQAARAARAALRLQTLVTGPLRISIATGRGEITGAIPFGEVVDRACALLDAPPPTAGIRVDALTTNLVEARFLTTSDGHGSVLLGELDSENVRSLLGRATPFVGRERELDALVAVLSEMKDESSPRLAVVTGEAGMGKSRLKIELAERLRDARALWLFGGGDVSQPGAPFGALSSALRRELGVRPDTPPGERRARVTTRLRVSLDENAAARVAPFLAQLAGAPFEEVEGSRIHAVRADAMAMGDALRAAWQDFLEAEGRARPVVIVLEDMQWGDRPSVTLALATLRALSSTRVALVVTGRPEIASVFPDLLTQRTFGATHVQLAPLGARASTRLLRELLPNAEQVTIDRLAQQAGGNPFLLEELARAVAHGRAGELPETVLASAQARLESVPSEQRRVLRAAAVLGDDVDDGGLAALLVDLDPKERAAQIENLVREEILERDPADPQRLRFRQMLLREASYASLTEGDKKLAHALAAAWLTARGSKSAVALATHFERAGNPAEACAHWVTAAEQSLEGTDLEGALTRLERARACGAEGETLGRLLFVSAEAHRWRGEHQKVCECSARAAKLLPEGSTLWLSAKVNEAMSSALLGNLAPTAAFATLLCILIEGGDVSGTVVAAGARTASMLLRYHASPEVARRLVRALSDAIPSCKDERAVGMVLGALATDAVARGDLEDALDFGVSGAASLARAGDVRNACMTRINAGYTMMLLGQWARAEAELGEGLALAERAGLRALAALAHHNLGPTLAQRGDVDRAEKHEREAVRAYADQGDKRLAMASRYYLGRILIARGKLEEAEAEMRLAREEAASIPTLAPLAAAGLTFALLARGRIAEALAAAREAEKKAAERGGDVEEPRVAKVALASALIASAESIEGAKLVSSLAVQLLEEANKLRDPELRKSFLGAVEDHARVFRLREALAQTE